VSERIKDGGPAFPCEQHETNDNNWNQTFEPGMTLRDYFAAKALVAVYADYQTSVRNGECDGDRDWRGEISRASWLMADAMLAAREAKS
jgi:hypothetical protein